MGNLKGAGKRRCQPVAEPGVRGGGRGVKVDQADRSGDEMPRGGCCSVGKCSISYLALAFIAALLFKVTVTRPQDSEAEMGFAHWLTV